jgi:hypothetical protein
MHLSLVGTLSLLLLGGSGVLAQETEEAPAADAPIVVTGTLECDADAAASDAGSVVNVHEWAASDPRLAGEATYSGTWQLYGEAQEDVGDPADEAPALYSIVNEGGSWLCEASRAAEQPVGEGDLHTLVFNGEGDYEGLTAYLHIDWSQAPYVFTGLILPGEEPPYAEPQG